MDIDEIQDLMATAWAARSGTDPSGLLFEGAIAFVAREHDGVLMVTSHVTGSSYEHELPTSEDDLGSWLDEIVSHDVYSYRHEPE